MTAKRPHGGLTVNRPAPLLGLGDLKLALELLKARRAEFAQHDELTEECYRKGYSVSHCIHGTSLWTDYDPMCGPCEDGYGYWDYQLHAEDVLGLVRSARRECVKRQRMVADLMVMGAPVTGEMVTWASAPIERLRNA